MIYTLGRDNALIALDATTGKKSGSTKAWPASMPGINYWQSEDGKDKRLLFSINSFLQAIDARTGKSIPSFGIDGIVDLRTGLARAEGTSITVQSNNPGKVWKNLLILGSAPGENFISPPGDIRAYDVVTGKKVWQFYTVPRPGDFGYETWPPNAYKYVGGSNNWGCRVDQERGIVYIPTGSATYDFYGADRHGANLFANCILALDTRTGKRLWHFQTIHHDLWDLDNVSAPQLITVRHNGQRVDAVAPPARPASWRLQPRHGRAAVADQKNGRCLRAARRARLAHQPYPTKPAPFGRQTFTVDDVNPWLLTPEQYTTLRERIAKAHVGPGPQGGLFIPTVVGEDYLLAIEIDMETSFNDDLEMESIEFVALAEQLAAEASRTAETGVRLCVRSGVRSASRSASRSCRSAKRRPARCGAGAARPSASRRDATTRFAQS